MSSGFFGWYTYLVTRFRVRLGCLRLRRVAFSSIRVAVRTVRVVKGFDLEDAGA